MGLWMGRMGVKKKGGGELKKTGMLIRLKGNRSTRAQLEVT